MRVLLSGYAAAIAMTLLLAVAAFPSHLPILADRFGRDVTGRGMTLVDWEGHIANPAMRYVLRPPPDLRPPIDAEMRADNARIYFDNPCEVGPNGPTKRLRFLDTGAAFRFFMSVFPDRDGSDETHRLTIRFADADGATVTVQVPVRVFDEDRKRPIEFPIVLDTTRDMSGFFGVAEHREMARIAANDWAYFFEDMRFDAVPSGSERTWIWANTGFHDGATIWNEREYTGFLLYLYGFHDPASPRSGGDASHEGGWQSSDCGLIRYPLRRSGAVGMETDGNYNTLGWYISTADDGWWKARNLRGDQCDLYSILRHEIGHSLVFHSAQARVAALHRRGYLDDTAVRAYLRDEITLDASEHIVDVNDRLSLKGPFGRDYFGAVPARRWLTTKLDLLIAQAVGYRLRATSAFQPLMLGGPSAVHGKFLRPVSFEFPVSGGLRPYFYRVAEGALPPGLTLDSFSGTAAGVPWCHGVFDAVIEISDYDPWAEPQRRRVRFSIRG